jgi:hypothetical protein
LTEGITSDIFTPNFIKLLVIKENISVRKRCSIAIVLQLVPFETRLCISLKEKVDITKYLSNISVYIGLSGFWLSTVVLYSKLL